MQGEIDFEADGWNKTVHQARTNLAVDATVVEVQKLRADVEKLQDLVLQLTKAMGKGGDGWDKVEKSTGKLSRGSTVSYTLRRVSSFLYHLMDNANRSSHRPLRTVSLLTLGMMADTLKRSRWIREPGGHDVAGCHRGRGD